MVLQHVVTNMGTGTSTDDTCQLCEPAPHQNCEGYTSVWIEDPMHGAEAEVRVCMEHYEAIEEVLIGDE